MKKEKSRLRLKDYLLKKKNYISVQSLIHDIAADKNLKILEEREVGTHHLIYISGFGEKEFFFIKLKLDTKKPYFYLSDYSVEEIN